MTHVLAGWAKLYSSNFACTLYSRASCDASSVVTLGPRFLALHAFVRVATVSCMSFSFSSSLALHAFARVATANSARERLFLYLGLFANSHCECFAARTCSINIYCRSDDIVRCLLLSDSEDLHCPHSWCDIYSVFMLDNQQCVNDVFALCAPRAGCNIRYYRQIALFVPCASCPRADCDRNFAREHLVFVLKSFCNRS